MVQDHLLPRPDQTASVAKLSFFAAGLRVTVAAAQPLQKKSAPGRTGDAWKKFRNKRENSVRYGLAAGG